MLKGIYEPLTEAEIKKLGLEPGEYLRRIATGAIIDGRGYAVKIATEDQK